MVGGWGERGLWIQSQSWRFTFRNQMLEENSTGLMEPEESEMILSQFYLSDCVSGKILDETANLRSITNRQTFLHSGSSTSIILPEIRPCRSLHSSAAVPAWTNTDPSWKDSHILGHWYQIKPVYSWEPEQAQWHTDDFHLDITVQNLENPQEHQCAPRNTEMFWNVLDCSGCHAWIQTDVTDVFHLHLLWSDNMETSFSWNLTSLFDVIQMKLVDAEMNFRFRAGTWKTGLIREI